MPSHGNMPSAGTVLSTAASIAASAMLLRSLANDFIPGSVQDYVSSTFAALARHFSSQRTIVIEELQEVHLNEVFCAVDAYLGTKISPSTTRIRLSKVEMEKDMAVSLDRNEELDDVFEDVRVRWRLDCVRAEPPSCNHRRRRHQGDPGATSQSEERSYQLTFHKQHMKKVLDGYIPYIRERYKAIQEGKKVLKLHTVEYWKWDPRFLPFDHPMTFDSLGMDSRVKSELMEDLKRFISGKQYYRRIGKAWKRGYLLYGPPGTGKSSVIAAMANYLGFDIYDLDLTDVSSNKELKFLLVRMPTRSMLVIEDIDCSIDLKNRDSNDTRDPNENQVTLSGVLNFIDGLWSSCAEGRIVVMTTNHRERLDPALLRPGRMDVHVQMSYCTGSAFRQLASIYLGVAQHPLFEPIEGLLEEVELTPAEAGGELMKTSDADASLRGLQNYLHAKRRERENATNPNETMAPEGGEETQGAK